MTHDIVDRLYSVNAVQAPYAADTVRAWCHEAAGEIERLRSALAQISGAQPWTDPDMGYVDLARHALSSNRR